MNPFRAPSSQRPVVVGHRGAPLSAPENTPSSFAAAADAGATWVELDARRCADDAVAVHHDAWLADGRPVHEMNVDELRRAGVWRLEDVLARLPDGLGVDVELKNFPTEPDYDEDERLATRVARTLRPYVGSRPLLVTSFNPSTAAACAAELRDVPAGLVHGTHTPVDAARDLAAEFGFQVVCPCIGSPGLHRAGVSSVHDAGLFMMVWTVDDPRTARELAAIGVDALCTNDVPALIAALAPGAWTG